VLFAIGSFIMIKGGLTSRAEEQAEEADELEEMTSKANAQNPTSAWKIYVTSFVILFTAEWGDLSQLLTAGLAARTDEPLSVFIGSWTALAVVSGIAVLVGNWLRSRVPIWRIRLVSGGILAALAIWTAFEFIRG
jgi:putative Ca2+/H+ antiporter (TMEM165/GDT1 family)